MLYGEAKPLADDDEEDDDDGDDDDEEEDRGRCIEASIAAMAPTIVGSLAPAFATIFLVALVTDNAEEDDEDDDDETWVPSSLTSLSSSSSLSNSCLALFPVATSLRYASTSYTYTYSDGQVDERKV